MKEEEEEELIEGEKGKVGHSCRWWKRHPWGPWKKVVKYWALGDPRKVPTKYIMESTCKECGKIKIKYIEL